MKIMDNGIVRNMTAEEEAAFLASCAEIDAPEDEKEYSGLLEEE